MSPTLAVAVLIATVAVLCGLLPFASHRSWLLLAVHDGCARPRFDNWDGPLPSGDGATAAVQRTGGCGAPHRRGMLPGLSGRGARDPSSRRLDGRDLSASLQSGSILGDDGVMDVHHIRRSDRTGFKAGALAGGTAVSRGEFLAIFDADFLPPPDTLRRMVGPFQDPGVGMVQARWDHLNEGDSALTRAQALLLDGHFFFEQGGRYRSRRFFNFNGTAGMWRRTCLEEAGGWRADTLTEDLDLSYRAQMAGWSFEFLEDVGVPAELPGTVAALQVQQRRWAQGGVQTARKLLPGLLRGDWSLGIKLEATIHLAGPSRPSTFTVALGLLLFPSALARRTLGLDHWMGLDLIVFAWATIPFVVFYLAAARKTGPHLDARCIRVRVPDACLGRGAVGSGDPGCLARLVGGE